MTDGNRQLGAEAIAAVAVAAALGTTVFESRLGTIVSRLHLSMLHLWVQWWPLLLIVAGAILLFRNEISQTRTRDAAQSRFTDT